MKSLRATALGGPLLFVLALGGAAIGAGGQSASEQRAALAPAVPARSARLGPGSAPSCPLSLAQQVKLVKAFAEMMPVFRHPRCTNCHGGVNPFVEEESAVTGEERWSPRPRSMTNNARIAMIN